MYFVAFCNAIGRAGVFPDGKFPLIGSFDYRFFIQKHGGANDLQVAAKERFTCRHAVGPSILQDIHEERDNIVVGIVTEGQVGKAIVSA